MFMMLKALRKTGIVFFPAFDWAISPTHPEREERLLYTQDQVREEGLTDIEGIIEYRVKQASYDDIRRVHFCVPDESAIASESHLLAAGGCIVAADAVMTKEVESAFALVRPPGHHAMKITHGNRGFCNINIEAIMIEYIRDIYGVDKVAIVDTDCHHGDGTQDIFWHDPDTLFISMHQDGRTLYPGTGFPNETGGPNAQGATINIPLPPGTGEEGFLYSLEELIIPILDNFQPEIIINSAGQDNHFTDPITNMNFSARGYAMLNSRLRPDLAVLEGGYSVEGALPYINTGIIMAMAGLDLSNVKEPNYDEEYEPQDLKTTETIELLISRLSKLYLKGEISKKQYYSGELVKDSKTIYYDTDGIIETRNEVIRACSLCSGVWSIESSASIGNHVFAVHIPRKTCNACRAVGEKWFNDASLNKKFTNTYLQDREKKEFIIR